MKLENNVQTESTWEIFEDRYVPDQAITTGSNYMIGNGYLGYRGTFADDSREQYVGCVITDTYDNADGVWKELVTAPNGLYTELTVDGTPLPWRDHGWSSYRRELSVRTAEWTVFASWAEQGVSVTERRFASAEDLHLLASRMEITADRAVSLRIATGIDGDIWSLNGEHFVSYGPEADGDHLQIACVTGEHAYDVIVREVARLELTDGVEIRSRQVNGDPRRILRYFELELEAGQTAVLTKYVGIYTTNDLRTEPNPFTAVPVPEELPAGGRIGITPGRVRNAYRDSDDDYEAYVAAFDPHRPARSEVIGAARRVIEDAVGRGWETVRAAHRSIWRTRWEDMDVAVEGDEIAQTVLRYNIYHNIIATPAHTDHLPIGARGLSCQAYQGAAFWDQEVFNLPMFLFSAPEIARNILVYRYRTLDGARRKARELGYRGAYYAWISGDSGEEICPSYFFKDVISGRPIRNHFNDWQIHVSPDVSYTVWKYVAVTHDWEYLREYGAEIVFEVARFLASRVYYRSDLDRYEIVRVLGPDEYHENVDNNFFTNYQARFATRWAVEVWDWLGEHATADRDRICGRIGLTAAEVEEWTTIGEKIYIPEPDADSGVIPQFDGFFRLEDTTPGEIKNRLLDPGEYWGWPNGIAVPTQVSKQADVTQLFVLHPTAFDREVMRVNWEYYEPRTQHGSSLSPAVYAIVAAWIGHMEEAERYFMKSCTVDLYNDNKAVSGGTFIGGIHTAACGISWQIVVTGFAGLSLSDGGFGFAPHLPAGWTAVSFVVKRWGARLRVRIARDDTTVGASGSRSTDVGVPLNVTVGSDDASARAIEITVGSTTVTVAPGAEVSVPYPG